MVVMMSHAHQCVGVDVAGLVLDIGCMARKRDDGLLATSGRVQAGFGSRLQQIRTQQKLSQADIADALRITRTSVSNIERGRHRIFLDQVYIVARRLGVEVADLLPGLDAVFVRQDSPHLAGSVPASATEKISVVARSVSLSFAPDPGQRAPKRPKR